MKQCIGWLLWEGPQFATSDLSQPFLCSIFPTGRPRPWNHFHRHSQSPTSHKAPHFPFLKSGVPHPGSPGPVSRKQSLMHTGVQCLQPDKGSCAKQPGSPGVSSRVLRLLALRSSSALLGLRRHPLQPSSCRQVHCKSQTPLQLPGATHLLAHVVVGQVDDRTEPLQHVKDQLSVTALSPRGGGKNARLEEGGGLGCPRTPRQGCWVGRTWKRATLLTML